ncbi:ABC transporter permease [Shouchella shacheensis]|uniref:ABC transporter permease n=1 Tax=Shouchella shacheensis TaxID=1649580 RepID=UPI0007402866|nr:ABC transporter permease [Shouchella shacheensis]
MGPLLKKDWLQIVDDRTALFSLIAMPLVLIAILGFSLSGSFNSTTDTVRLAVVDEGHYEEAIENWQEQLQQAGLPAETETELLKVASELSVPELLLEDVLQEEEVASFLEVSHVETVDAARENDEFAAVLQIPSGYRLEMWEQLLLDTEAISEGLSLYTNSERSYSASVIETILDEFFYELSLQSVLAQSGETESRETLGTGGRITQHQEEPITSFDYYAVSMSVMFMLIVSVFVASYAMQEKRSHVFARVLLANTSGLDYLTSKWLMTTIVGVVQLCVLFGFSRVVFGVEWGNLAGFFLVTLTFSASVGGIGTLLTAINFRLNSEKASSIFQVFLFSIFAFIGGNWFPVEQLSTTIARIGSWTPNGRGLNVYLQVLQGAPVTEVAHSLLILCGFAIVLVGLACLVFPRRGDLQ